jgi:uncharacterized protein YyaL (SSP411 family)
MIKAYVDAYRVFRKQDYQNKAQKATEFILKNNSDNYRKL